MLTLAAAACRKDETISGFVPEGAVWQLEAINGADFAANATLAFPEPGKITGDAPCNSYFASQSAPYPWIAIDDIGSTRRACPALPAEQEFLSSLAKMTLAEVAGDVLVLSNDAGNEMIFRVITPDG